MDEIENQRKNKTKSDHIKYTNDIYTSNWNFSSPLSNVIDVFQHSIDIFGCLHKLKCTIHSFNRSDLDCWHFNKAIFLHFRCSKCFIFLCLNFVCLPDSIFSWCSIILISSNDRSNPKFTSSCKCCSRSMPVDTVRHSQWQMNNHHRFVESENCREKYNKNSEWKDENYVLKQDDRVKMKNK